jgi:hypothetical protein
LRAPAQDTFGQGLTQSPSNAALLNYAGGVEDENGVVALDQTLREITNPFTVLSVSARPGDEDDGALAYVRKKLGARAVMLFGPEAKTKIIGLTLTSDRTSDRFIPTNQLKLLG